MTPPPFVLTRISDLSGEISWKHIEDLGFMVVETTAHHNARPSHVLWQGKRFSLNESVEEIRVQADVIREADKGIQAMRKAEKTEKENLHNSKNDDIIYY